MNTIEFKTLQTAVSNLYWNLNFFQFCHEILKVDRPDEQLETDCYCLEKWELWQKFNTALNTFDDEILSRIITTYHNQ